MTAFKIDVRAGEVIAALNRLAAASRDMSPAMRAIARALRNATEDAFAQQRSPFGPAWAALNKSTIEGRKGGGVNARILIDSGQLAASISATSNATSATLTAGKEYAAIHQFGGQAGRGKKVTIVPRPFLPITKTGELAPQTQREVVEIVQEYLLAAWGG